MPKAHSCDVVQGIIGHPPAPCRTPGIGIDSEVCSQGAQNREPSWCLPRCNADHEVLCGKLTPSRSGQGLLMQSLSTSTAGQIRDFITCVPCEMKRHEIRRALLLAVDCDCTMHTAFNQHNSNDLCGTTNLDG